MNKFLIKKRIIEEQARLSENPEQMSLGLPEENPNENKYRILKYLGNEGLQK